MRSSRYRYRAFCIAPDGKRVEVTNLDKATAIQITSVMKKLGARDAIWHSYLPAPESAVMS